MKNGRLKCHYGFLICLAIVYLVLTACYAYADLTWENSYRQINDLAMQAGSIKQTIDGGYIVTGSIAGSENTSNLLVMKLYPSGAIAWQKAYGEMGYYLSPPLIQQTNDGGYLIAATGYFGESHANVFIIKLDSTGNIIWQKTYGGSSRENVNSIQQTNDGGYIVAASINDYEGDIWIFKLDASGNIIWQKTYGGPNFDYANSIQQTSDGKYIVAASTSSYGVSPVSAWILKLKPAGAIEWQKTFGTHSTDSTNISTIFQTNDGNYIGVGAIGDPNNDVPYLWIIKLSSSGTILWQKSYCGFMYSYAPGASGYDIHQTNDGGYIIAGETGLCEDPGCFTDGWMLKLDSSGNLIWQYGIGGSSLQTVQQTSDNGYVTIWQNSYYPYFYVARTDAAGNVNASCPFYTIEDVQPGTYTVGSQNSLDTPRLFSVSASDTNFAVIDYSIERITVCGSTIPNLISIKPAIDDSTSTTPNGIIEENETVSLIGNLENAGTVSADSVSGVLSSTSPIVINNPNAAYPNIPAQSTQISQTNYSITAPSANRQAPHWDIVVTETPSCTGCLSSAYHFTYHIGNSFNDVAPQKLFYPSIETIFHASITSGCAQRFYCPLQNVPREQLAKFICASLQKAGGACSSMPCQSLFNDVPNQNPFCPYIEALYNEGMIAGCQANPLLYCPGTFVSRQEMAKFLCNAMNAVIPNSCSYASCTGIFGDVSSANPFCPYIEGIYAAGIISGCQSSPLLFCPDNNVSREQMAKFLVNAFDFGL